MKPGSIHISWVKLLKASWVRFCQGWASSVKLFVVAKILWEVVTIRAPLMSPKIKHQFFLNNLNWWYVCRRLSYKLNSFFLHVLPRSSSGKNHKQLQSVVWAELESKSLFSFFNFLQSRSHRWSKLFKHPVWKVSVCHHFFLSWLH